MNTLKSVLILWGAISAAHIKYETETFKLVIVFVAITCNIMSHLYEWEPGQYICMRYAMSKTSITSITIYIYVHVRARLISRL